MLEKRGKLEKKCLRKGGRVREWACFKNRGRLEKGSVRKEEHVREREC